MQQTLFATLDPLLSVNYEKKTQGNLMTDFSFHSHDHFEIYFFHQGKCHYFIHDKIYDMSPGDMLIMHGMTLHRANPHPEIDYVRSMIHVSPYYLKDILRSIAQVDLLYPFTQLKNVYLKLYDHKDEINDKLKQLHTYHSRRDSPLDQVRAQLTLVELLVFIYDQCQQNEHVTKRRSEDQPRGKMQNVQTVLSYLEDHYQCSNLTLDDIANATYLSKHYVSRIFKEVTGVSLMDFILNKKINQAKILLLTNQSSITQISDEIGFKHLAHFSRVFKQKVGSTAEQYRKEKAHTLL